jgi:O-acetyl-ADP-ribose deacetylase (regulator of RNase III)
MSLGGRTTRDSLKASIDDTLRIASDLHINTIAIPAVGTGIAGFPIEECAHVMAECLSGALAHGWQPQEVRFVLFGDDAKDVFEAAFRHVFTS